MSTVLFVALATPDPAGGYRAAFPDAPDCVVKAPDIAALLAAARQALAAQLQRTADARGMSRSGFIAQAVRVSLGERGPGNDFEAATRKLQEELQALGRKINDSIGPGSDFSRAMSELDDQVYEGVRKVADKVSAAMTRRREARNPAAAPSEPPPPTELASRDGYIL